VFPRGTPTRPACSCAHNVPRFPGIVKGNELLLLASFQRLDDQLEVVTVVIRRTWVLLFYQRMNGRCGNTVSKYHLQVFLFTSRFRVIDRLGTGNNPDHFTTPVENR
jgi:hypothetical protein